MKVIYKDSQTSVLLGNDFESDFLLIVEKNKLKKKAAIVVIGFNDFDKTDYYKQFENILKQNLITIVKIIKVKPNPSEAQIIKEAAKFKGKFDLVITIGGGSGTDAGKLVKYHFNDFAKIISIYTLPGSAAILSPFAIFNNNEFKVGLASDSLIPNCSYINRGIIGSINYDLKIIAIADIFSHAIESLFSTISDDFIKKESKKSLKLLIDKSVKNLSLDDFVMADVHAGLAERRGLVLFPHAAGHYLTYKFHIPHSIATMYFLPKYLIFLRKSGIDIDSKYIKYSKYLRSLLINEELMKDIKLSRKNVAELFYLTKKYMNFVYDNAPIYIKQEEYESII